MTAPLETAPSAAEAVRPASTPWPPLPVLSAASLLALAAPPPALLGPIAPGTITLIRGARGVGKSWLALAIARAIAGGTGLLGWSGRAAPVLYVEAAMSEGAVARRLQALGPVSGSLGLLCDRAPDLSNDLEAEPLARHLPREGTGVLVLDGLALLVPPGRGAAQRWRGVGDWLRRLRRAGHAVVVVDHARRPPVEDLADTVIGLKPLADGQADLDLAVTIASREPLARADRAFAAHLNLAPGPARWTRSALVDPALQAVADQATTGATVRNIAEALGLSVSTAWRRLERAKAAGLLAESKPPETGETRPAAKPAETGETAPLRKRGETSETAAPRKPSETPETGPDLARVSPAVLERTLEKRLKAHGRASAAGPRPGPAILARVGDADLLAACIARMPQRAARLRDRFAPLLAPPLPRAA